MAGKMHCRACCPQPDSCTIDTDPFDTDLAKWTQASGAWAVSGGLLDAPTSGVLLLDEPAATEDDGVHFITFPQLTGSSGEIKLIIAGTDADNNYWGKLSISGGVGTIKVGERSGGVDSDLSDPVTLSDTGSELEERHALSICFQPGVTQPPVSTSQLRYPRGISGTSWTDLGNGSWLWLFGGPSDPISNTLNAGDFRFRIPKGSSIDGIRLSAYCATTGVSAVTASANITNGTPITGVAVPSGGAGGWVHFGGPTNTWSAGLDYTEVNDITFGASLEFVNLDGDEQITVGPIVIQVFYTTPARRFDAKLEFTYVNSSTLLPQCARKLNIGTPGGLQAGIGIASGDWDFTAATYSYSAPQRAGCPECDCITVDGQLCPDCCTDPPLFEYVVNLGAGGWANNDCTFCEDIAGSILVEQIEACVWEYFEDVNCELESPADCVSTGGLSAVTGWAVTLYLVYDPSLEECLWLASVGHLGGTSVADPSDDCFDATGNGPAWYESASFSPTVCGVTPSNLTLISGGTTNGPPCVGTLPLSITVEAP